MKRTVIAVGVMCLALGATLAYGSSAGAAPETGRPSVGDCTNAPLFDNWVLTEGAVDCLAPHTGQTVYVGRWRSTVSPTAANDLDEKANERLLKQLQPEFDACDKAADELLGRRVSPTATKSSWFSVNGTGPNDEEWAKGERWFRCDVVAQKAPEKFGVEETPLTSIPGPDELKGFLRQVPTAWGDYKRCVKRDPSDGLYYFFTCKKAWRNGQAVVWVNPNGKYPGSEDAAFDQMQRQCLSIVRKLQKSNVHDSTVWVLNFTKFELTKSSYSKSLWLCMLNLSG